MRDELRIVSVQLSVVLAVSLLFWLVYPVKPNELCAVLYGGSISLVASVVMVLRVRQAISKQGSKAQYVYLGAFERLLITIASLGIGMGWLNLPPAQMIVGLVIGQVGFMIGGYKTKN